MKTTLTLEIEYDPTKTDPEGLASAFDRLLETALSTPGILDEYGNPKADEFLIAAETPSPLEAAYELQIDGPLFRNQRQLLLKIMDCVSKHQPYIPAADDADLLEGATALLDELADQAHDRHGIDCLLEDGETESSETESSGL